MSSSPPHESYQERIPSAPYALISEEERRRRAQELLAKHARVWDAYIARYKANIYGSDYDGQHTSVLTIDAQWREKQRVLARADAYSRTNYEISWYHSLRTDERLVEMRLGRVNPVVFYYKVNPVSVAIKNILEMPVYVPVIEKLPPDLARKNRDFLAYQLQQAEGEAAPDDLEVPMSDDFSYESEYEYAGKMSYQVDELSNSMQPIQKSSRYQSMIPAGEMAYKADNIARAITMSYLYYKKEQKFDFNYINRQVIIQREQIVAPLIKPVVSVNSLTCVNHGNGNTSTAFKLTNIGDCSVEVQIKQKDMTAAAERDKNKRSTQRFAPLQYQQEDIKSNTSAAPSISRRSDVNRAPPSPVSLLGQVKAKYLQITKCKNSSFTKSGIQTTKLLDNSSNQYVKREDMIYKMIDKSAMPAHLRILASRCVYETSQSHGKIVLATQGSKWRVSVGETTEIEFMVPHSSEDSQPGIILEEYEVIVQPPCEVVFESKDDIKSGSQNIVQEKDGTRICVRCYGISSYCLQLDKQIYNYALLGQQALQRYYVANTCEELVFELADFAFLLARYRRKDEEQLYHSTLESAKHLEDIVVDCYQKNIIKAKYVTKDNNERRDYLFELFTDYLGYNYTAAKVFDDYFGVDGDSSFDKPMQPSNNFFLQPKPKLIEALNMRYLEFAKNSVFAVKAKSLSHVTFKFHYLYENLSAFDKFRRNSFDLVRKRLIGLISDKNGKRKIAINQTPISEQYLLQNAVRSTILNTALFARFNPSKIVSLLIDKLVNFILPSLARQIFVYKRLKKSFVDQDFRFYAPSRANYDGNLIGLLLLAAATAVREPVWDIFNCLDTKLAAEIPRNRRSEEKGDQESDAGVTNKSYRSDTTQYEESPESLKWAAIRASYLRLYIIRMLLYQVSVYSEGEPYAATVKNALLERVKALQRSTKAQRNSFYHFTIDSTSPFACSLDQPTMDAIVKLIYESAPVSSDYAIQLGITEEHLDYLAFDLHILLEREFLYNQTMSFRTFLTLFYLEAKNINNIDPFSVLGKAYEIQLTYNADFLADTDSSVEYYAHVFGEELRNVLERYSKAPERPGSANKAGKNKKELVYIIESKPFQLDYSWIYRPNRFASEFEFKESIARSIYVQLLKSRDAQPISARGKKNDSKKEQSQVQIVLHNAIKGVFFADMESQTLFSSALYLVLQGDERILNQDYPVDRISMQQMLVDVVLTICNVAATPKLPVFDNFVIRRNSVKIQQFSAAAGAYRDKLIADIVSELDVQPQYQLLIKGRSGKQSADPEAQTAHDASKLRQNVASRLSSVVFYPVDALVQLKAPRQSALSRMTKTDIILQSSYQLAVHLEVPVKKFGQGSDRLSNKPVPHIQPSAASKLSESYQKADLDKSPLFQAAHSDIMDAQVVSDQRGGRGVALNLQYCMSDIRSAAEMMQHVYELEFSDERYIAHTDSSSFAAEEGDENANELVLSKQLEIDRNRQLDQSDVQKDDLVSCPALEGRFEFEHELRIQAFKQEFDSFIDSLFTETVENAISLHLENLYAYEEDVDDYETMRAKMTQLKTGELTYEQAGIDPGAYQDPDEISVPSRPTPALLFKEVDELAELNETYLLEQSRLMFCLDNNVELLRSIADFLYRCFSDLASVLKANGLQAQEQAAQVDRALYEVRVALQIVQDDVCVPDARDDKRSQSAKKDEREKADKIPPTYKRSRLFAAISKYGALLDIVFALPEQLNAYQHSLISELRESAQSNPQITVLETVRNRVVDLAQIDKFVFRNPAKLCAKPHAQALLLSTAGLFGQRATSAVQIDQVFEPTVEMASAVFEKLGVSSKDSGAKDKRKTDAKTDAKTEEKLQSHSTPGLAQRTIYSTNPAEPLEEDVEFEEEESEDEKLAPYLRECSPETLARREVWAHLFSQCLERAFNWFDVSKRAEANWEKAVNYLARDWAELHDE